MSRALVWLTRDLRAHDHPALAAAGEAALPVFCLDERLLRGGHASGPRARLLLGCLAELDERLGGRVVFRRGAPERELPELARAAGAREVHFSVDSGPFARRRARRVAQALAAAGARLVGHPGLHAVDDLGELRTGAGGPYTVFTPFWRAWLAAPRRQLAPPAGPPAPLPEGIEKGALPSVRALGLSDEVAEPPQPGERAGRRRLERFLRDLVGGYDGGRDALAGDATSRLSPYLHLGAVSPREIEQRLPGGRGAEAFRRQLAWRDFHHHVLLHFPGNLRHEFQERRRGRIAWRSDEQRFAAWCEGRTGYPLVDAGMRQLRREGWMHNRARLVVASFLTKELGIDWRRGERWFMRWLVDGDLANNNGNWQWIASVGVDPQPFYRRFYNPARQQRRFDPGGGYVRRHLPELRDVPDEHLAEPWLMPEEAQRACGCVIGRDYPGPVVDRELARREALERYGA